MKKSSVIFRVSLLSVFILLVACANTQKHLKSVKDDFSNGNIGMGIFGTLVTPGAMIVDAFTLGGTLTPEESATAITTASNSISHHAAMGAPAQASSLVTGIPADSCRAWTPAQQKQVGDMLLSKCKNVCAKYNAAAQAGGQRTLYESAACMEACYVNNLPEDCPDVPKLKQSAMDNYNQARALGGCGDCPTVGHGGLPSTQMPSIYSSPDGVGIQDNDCIAKHSCVVAPAQ